MNIDKSFVNADNVVDSGDDKAGLADVVGLLRRQLQEHKRPSQKDRS